MPKCKEASDAVPPKGHKEVLSVELHTQVLTKQFGEKDKKMFKSFVAG